MTQLATALKTKRRLSGEKQSDLAQRIGCSQQLIGRWETGAGVPGSRYIQALAEFLGVDEGEVLRMAFSGDEDADEITARLDAQDQAIERLTNKLARLVEMLELVVEEDEHDQPPTLS